MTAKQPTTRQVIAGVDRECAEALRKRDKQPGRGGYVFIMAFLAMLFWAGSWIVGEFAGYRNLPRDIGDGYALQDRTNFGPYFVFVGYVLMALTGGAFLIFLEGLINPLRPEVRDTRRTLIKARKNPQELRALQRREQIAFRVKATLIVLAVAYAIYQAIVTAA